MQSVTKKNSPKYFQSVGPAKLFQFVWQWVEGEVIAILGLLEL